jgi:hypothetical protein
MSTVWGGEGAVQGFATNGAEWWGQLHRPARGTCSAHH